MSGVSETQTCSFSRIFLEALQRMHRGPSPPSHALTWARRVPRCWGGGPRAPGAAPGDSVSRCPCSGGPLGQVLCRGRVPGPGGVVLLICMALGEFGEGLSPIPSQRSLLLPQTPLPESLGATLGPPTPWTRLHAPGHPLPPPSLVPVQVNPTSSSWSQLCCPHAPAGQSLSEASVPLQPMSSSQMGPVPGP